MSSGHGDPSGSGSTADLPKGGPAADDAGLPKGGPATGLITSPTTGAPSPGRRIDLHVHLAGLPGDASGCLISPRMRRSWQFHGLRFLLGLSTRDPLAANRAYADRLVELVSTSQELDHVCVFAMDGVYDAGGEMLLAESHMYVPNDYVFAVCRRDPRLLPVISINPQRADAMEELARWGPDAVAIKWLGPLQKFDASDPRYDRFYDQLRELRLPVIAHAGCEHTFPGMAQRLGDPLLYERVLRRGIPVIFSHCGTGSWMFRGHDYSREFVEMLERYDHAYGDCSAFCSILRRKELRRFAVDRYMGRIFQGSDWPTPGSALAFLPELGFDRVRSLVAVRHPLDRDVATKRLMGVPDPWFTGAYDLLESRITAWQRLASAGSGPLRHQA